MEGVYPLCLSSTTCPSSHDLHQENCWLLASLVQEFLLTQSGESNYDIGGLNNPNQAKDVRAAIQGRIGESVGPGEDLIHVTGLDIYVTPIGGELVQEECGRSEPLTSEDVRTLYSLELGMAIIISESLLTH